VSIDPLGLPVLMDADLLPLQENGKDSGPELDVKQQAII